MSIRHLRKQIVPEVLARALGKRPHVEPTNTIKRQKPPRKSDTYRAARRNAVLRSEPRGVWQGAEVIIRHCRTRSHTSDRASSNPDYTKPNGERQRARLGRQHAKQQAKVA